MRTILLSLLSIFFHLSMSAQSFNEVCPSNVSVYELEDEDENLIYLDWVEFINDSPDDINLIGYSLSDSIDKPNKWVFPDTLIESDSYLVIAADPESENEGFISFNLGRKGGELYLFDPTGVLVDFVTRPLLEPNHSYGKLDGKWYYYDEPTPGLTNFIEMGYKGYCTQPIVNRVSGAQLAGTSIVLRPNNPDDQVYYSLNGTNPLSGSLYTTPIILNKTTSLTIAATADSLLPSPPIYRSYFVNISHKLPVVHLTIDSLELLDETVGIYVLGPDASDEYPYYGANFWKDIELHAYYEFFDTDFRPGESLDCGVKIHGGTVSSTRPMKSLRLVAHDRYENEQFSTPYFSNKENSEFRRLLLRNSGSDFNRTHLKDGILHQFVLDHDLDMDAQGYRPVLVYINGIFWGIHNMREKLDKHYVWSNYGIDAETVNLLEEEELIVIAGDSTDFISLRDYVIANDLNKQEHFEWVEAHLDTKSMVDYFIMELYSNNRDWPYNNLKLWNSPDQPRWRYFFSDLDAGIKYYGNTQLDYNSLEYILGPYGDGNVHVVIFKKLLENKEFQRYFINRYADLVNTIFAKDYILDYIYKGKAKIEPEIQYHFYKWWGVKEEWEEHFLEYDKFFSDREDIVREELSIVFDKDPAIDLYIGMYPANKGSVILNTLTLKDYPFTGKYYTNNPIDLSIKNDEGNEFLYWENLRTGEQYRTKSIQINPTDKDSLIAVFKSDDLFQLRLFPVPVVDNSELNFSLPNSGAANLQITSLEGKQLGGKSWSYLAKGNHTESYDFNGLSSGVYLLTLSTEYGKETIRFVLKK